MFTAKNFQKAMSKVRGARPGDMIINPGETIDVPKSSKYQAHKKAKLSSFGRTAALYGTHRKSPHPTTIIKDKAEGWEMAVGEVERLNDGLKERREFRWFLEVIISLSDQTRTRVWSATLFPPYQLQVDPQSFRDSRRHLEHMNHRAAQGGHFEALLRGFFDEDLEELAEFNNVPVDRLPGGGGAFILQENYSIDGLLHLFREICDGTHPRITYTSGAPVGDTMIRVSLDTSYGIVFTRSSLDQKTGRDMVQAWLNDIKEFTRGDNRNYYYDVDAKAYSRRERDQVKPTSNHVESMLSQMAKGTA